jgi:hypothetical protein
MTTTEISRRFYDHAFQFVRIRSFPGAYITEYIAKYNSQRNSRFKDVADFNEQLIRAAVYATPSTDEDWTQLFLRVVTSRVLDIEIEYQHEVSDPCQYIRIESVRLVHIAALFDLVDEPWKIFGFRSKPEHYSFSYY